MIVLWWIAVALAWESVGLTWDPQHLPIGYWIDTDLDSELDDAEGVAAIREGVEVWNGIDCGVHFEYRGRAEGTPFGGEADGRSVFYLPGSSWPEDPSEVAATRTWVHGNDLVEVDYAMNGHHYVWQTTGTGEVGSLDVRGAATEGAGHVLGLDHSAVEDASLHPAMVGQPGAYSLTDDDIAGACALYLDRPAPGLGDRCMEPDDCGAALVCVVDESGGFCSRECNTDADCGTPWMCARPDDLCVLDTAPQCGCDATASPTWWPLMALAVVFSILRGRPRHSRTAVMASTMFIATGCRAPSRTLELPTTSTSSSGFDSAEAAIPVDTAVTPWETSSRNCAETSETDYEYSVDWAGTQLMLQDWCVHCHSVEGVTGWDLLEVLQTQLTTGDHAGQNILVVPNEPYDSVLWSVMWGSRDTARMPYNALQPLPCSIRGHVYDWIAAGAPL